MKEEWRDIKNYEGLYQVSNLGRIKSLKRKTEYFYKRGGNHEISEKYIKLLKNSDGYLNCYLYKNGKKNTLRVHRLVAMAFIPNPDGKLEVNHINGCKNDNRLENLEWSTRSENQKHAFKTELQKPKKSKEHYKSKKINQYDLEEKYIKTWNCMSDVEKNLGVLASKICLCCQGKRKTAGGYIWKYKEETNE